MSRIKSLLFLSVLAAQVPLASATVTYAVGTCLPKLTNFPTITQALKATPAPNVVEVCPGTYLEQLDINFPVTLEGVSNGTATGATIAVPVGGLSINQDDDFGDQLAAQVLVYDTAVVNLSNLTVDGSANGPPNNYGAPIVGVFYKNSSGTIKGLNFLNQWDNPLASAVWLEGGSANPSVTVENNMMTGFYESGIRAETNSGTTSELTATIKGNILNGNGAPCECGQAAYGINFGPGVTASVTNNFVTNTFYGMYAASKGSVSTNTLVSNAIALDVETDDASVTSNTVYIAGEGVAANSAVSPVTGNSIVVTGATPAIEFNCIGGSNVRSNTILGGGAAFDFVPSGTVLNNPYYDVAKISTGSCP